MPDEPTLFDDVVPASRRESTEEVERAADAEGTVGSERAEQLESAEMCERAATSESTEMGERAEGHEGAEDGKRRSAARERFLAGLVATWRFESREGRKPRKAELEASRRLAEEFNERIDELEVT